MSGARPRVVVVTRKTLLQELLARHGTHAQARFYLKSRGQDITDAEEAHARFERGLGTALSTLPADQRRTRVDRDDLDRFLFAPDDVVVMVGQDGLVANTAKYLDGQIAIGINPDPERYDGVLSPHRPEALRALLVALEKGELRGLRLQRRVMAEAVREDGQRLLALNEIFVGHASHQSARYTLRAGAAQERHSSSGLIASTGTGCTGWALSLARQQGREDLLVGPEDPTLVWWVREPFPSVSTGTSLNAGHTPRGEALVVRSHMGTGGVVFADGIETDRLEFLEGQVVTVQVAARTLNLLVPAPVA